MDDASEAMPGAIVEGFLERERGARALLDELEKLLVEGKTEEVRERIRSLAENDEAVFYTVAFSLTDSKQFFGDVEAQLDVTAADRLRDLAETHPALADPFAMVSREDSEDRKNPVTDTRYAVSYHHGIDTPVVTYAPMSGEHELYESRATPSEVLHLASDLVAASTDAIEVAMEHEHTVNTDELGHLIDRWEELESATSRLQDDLDELRRTPVDDN